MKISALNRFHPASISLVAGVFFISGQMYASTWTGGNANWSSNGSPGWNATGVPNAIGAVADHAVSTTTTTTQDIGAGVTVGTISLSNNSNNSWSFTLTNALTLNQDSGGAGKATISNTNTNTGTTNALIINAGTLTLADDLLISNTGASTATNGAIQVLSTIGGTGNITLSNASTALTLASSIRIQTGINTFSGSVLVQKGTTTFNSSTAFGGTGNAITIGQSGQGSAALLTTSGSLSNNVTIASGSGGTLTLGRIGTGTSTFSGTVLLNGGGTFYSEVTNATGMLMSNTISGVGTLTKTGTGILALSAANTYSGDTVVSAGTLKLNNALALQNSALDTSGAGSINATVTTLTMGGLKGSTNLGSVITTGYSTVTALTLNPGTGVTNTYSGVIADGASGMTLTKSGAGTQILNAASTYTGATLISGGTLALGASGTIDNTSSVSLGTSGTFDVSAKSGYSVTTLKGSGTVKGNLTVSTQLAIGNSPGTTNFDNNLTLTNATTYLYDMTGGASPGVGSADLGNVTGTLALASAVLDLVELGTYTVGNKFTLFGYTGGISGTFATLADDTTFLDDLSNTWKINYNDGFAGMNGGIGSSFVTITAVPEPNMASLVGAIGVIGLLRRRR